MTKKSLAIAASVLAIVGIVGYLYFTSANNQAPEATATPAAAPRATFFYPALSYADASLYYYDLAAQTINRYRFGDHTTVKLLETQELPDKIYWSPDYADIIINTNLDNQHKARLVYYNLSTGQRVVLDPNVYDPIETTGQGRLLFVGENRILYNYRDTSTNKGFLSTANRDGSTWQSVGQVTDDIVDIIQFEPPKTVVYSTYDPLAIVRVNFATNARETLVTEPAIIVPDGKNKVAFVGAVQAGKSITYSLLNLINGEKISLDLPETTIPTSDRIAWERTGQSLYLLGDGKLVRIDRTDGTMKEAVVQGVDMQSITRLLGVDEQAGKIFALTAAGPIAATVAK